MWDTCTVQAPATSTMPTDTYMGHLYCSGPYYKYHIYRDWLRQEKPENIPLQAPLIAKSKHLPVIITTYFICSYFFSIQVRRMISFVFCRDLLLC